MTIKAETPSRPIGIAVNPFESPRTEVVRLAMIRRLDDLEPPKSFPDGYQFLNWSPLLLSLAARVARNSFARSPEVELYPQLASTNGCVRMISELVCVPGFLPEASGLVLWYNEPVAMIIANRSPGCVFGEVQMVAVRPLHQRIGLGSLMVNQALWTFHDRFLPHAIFRVNRSNHSAIRFFRTLGFQANMSVTYR